IAVVVLGVLWYILTNNSLIRARNKVDEAWSGIDVQLKRRHDLIPNLVETVKGYAAHEQQTFQRVTEARAQAIAAENAPPAERSSGVAPASSAAPWPRLSHSGSAPRSTASRSWSAARSSWRWWSSSSAGSAPTARPRTSSSSASPPRTG